MGRKSRKRRIDEHGYYRGTDNTEARIHGLDVPPITPVSKKEYKWHYKISKTEAKTQKSYATAAKRTALASLIKWILIALGVIYGLTKLGGGGLLEKAKGLVGL